MKTNKILIGGFAGGVTFFFLGWLVYGILLNSYMVANLNQCAAKPMGEMTWWAMILSNLTLGLLISLVFSWSNTRGVRDGAKVAAILGLLMAASFDLSSYSMSNLFNNITALVIDVLVYTVLVTIVGVVVALVIGKKED
jgi:uncharacterized membrane protein YbaN (DUF454 family)